MRANKEKSKSLIRRFVAYYRPYKWLFAADLFSAAINGGVGLVFPAMIRYIINDVFTMPDTSLIAPILTKMAILMFVLYLVEAGSLYFVSSWGHILGARIETDMRRDLFEHMEKLSFSFFDKTSTGKMVSRLISDLSDITELAHHGPENLFISAFKIVGSFIILSRIHFPMSMILLGFTILLVIVMFGYRAKMTNVFMDNRRRIADVNALIQDSLSGIRTVQSFSNEQIEIEKFHHGNEAFYHSKKRMYFFMGKYFTLNQFMQGMLYLVTLITGGIYVIQGTLRPGDAIAFILYINMYLAPIRTLIMFNEQFQKGMSGFRRMVEFLDTEPDIVDRQDAVDAGTLRGTIEFDHVAFSYGEEEVLSDLSFTIETGKTVALVGPSGVGKTTICSLIPRFYDVTGGRVLIDGTDIRDFTLRSLRNNIAVVQQDVYLFNSTVRENISYGDWEAEDDAIRKAAENAQIHEFIESLPSGYETIVGERGVRFSGGERQRVSIARAFLRNPSILILDEATSSLDNISERAIQAALDVLSRDRTTLVIAHRLSTIRNADEILVLSNGGIVERGTHEELLEKGGEYAFLYQSQFADL